MAALPCVDYLIAPVDHIIVLMGRGCHAGVIGVYTQEAPDGETRKV